MDCKQINEFMLEYLYQELDTAEMERVQAHLQSCAGCADELAAFERTRSMMQGLQDHDPAPAITDLLLKEAAKAAVPQTASFWDRLRDSMRMMVLHPAMTAAVTLVLVLGVSFYVYRESSPPTSPMELETLGVEIDQPMGEAATITLPTAEQDKAQQGATVDKESFAGERERVARQAAEPNQDMDEKIAAVQVDSAKEDTLQRVATRGRAGGAAANEKKSGFALGNAEQSPLNQRDDVRRQLSASAAETRSTARRDNRPAAPAAKPAPTKSKGLLSSNIGSLGSSGAKAVKSEVHNKAPMQPQAAGNRQAIADPFVDDTRYRGKKRSRGQSAPAPKLAQSAEQLKAKPAPRPRPSRAKAAPSADLSTGSFSEADDTLNAKAPTKKVRKPAARRFKKRPAPNVSKQRMSRKGPSKDDKADSYKLLALANEASAQSRCGAAFQYYNQALAMNPDLRNIISKRIQTCTSRMVSKDEGALASAQKSYPRLASMMEPALRTARRARKAKAKAKADETQKKASKAKKSQKTLK